MRQIAFAHAGFKGWGREEWGREGAMGREGRAMGGAREGRGREGGEGKGQSKEMDKSAYSQLIFGMPLLPLRRSFPFEFLSINFSNNSF